MADDHGDPAIPDGDAAELERARVLIDALLDGCMAEAGREELERMVVRNPAVARQYLRAVHLSCCMPLHVNDASRLGPPLPDDARLDEAMIVPALVERTTAGADLAPPVEATPETPVAGRIRPRWPRVLGIAASVAVVAGVGWYAWPRPPAATITATAFANAADLAVPWQPGTPVQAGQALRVESGAVELTFRDGAVVVARAPTTLRVLGSGALALDNGGVCAHVPPSALGFRVDSPGLSVVDRGTDFGVRAEAGETSVAVYKGRVDVSPVDWAGRATAAPVALLAGHAVRRPNAAGTMAPAVDAPFSPGDFDGDISTAQLPVPAHGTGEGVAAGRKDSAWQITQPGGDPATDGLPAVVVHKLPVEYVENAPDARAAWVSTADPLENLPTGRFVFRTTVDLTGFNPAAVQAVARVAANDVVVDVKLNGISTGATTPHDSLKASMLARHDVPIIGPWLAGVNQVDVVVENLPPHQPRVRNSMALQLDWRITAAPLVHR